MVRLMKNAQKFMKMLYAQLFSLPFKNGFFWNYFWILDHCVAFFDELKGFRERFKWVKAVVHPLTRAGNSNSKGVSVLDKSNMARTLG